MAEEQTDRHGANEVRNAERGWLNTRLPVLGGEVYPVVWSDAVQKLNMFSYGTHQLAVAHLVSHFCVMGTSE